MKKLGNLSIYISAVLMISSCENEITERVKVNNINNLVGVIDGRISFKSKEEFVKIYNVYADASDIELAKYFMPLYKNGFYSLRPIFTSKNEEFIATHYRKITPQISKKTNLQSNSAIDDTTLGHGSKFNVGID